MQFYCQNTIRPKKDTKLNWPPRYNWNIVEVLINSIKQTNPWAAVDILRYTWGYPTSYYDFVLNRQNRCEFVRHFMTVRFVINFRTLGNMFLSSIYVTEGEMGYFCESVSDILRYFQRLRKHCWNVWEFDNMLLNDGHILA